MKLRLPALLVGSLFVMGLALPGRGMAFARNVGIGTEAGPTPPMARTMMTAAAADPALSPRRVSTGASQARVGPASVPAPKTKKRARSRPRPRFSYAPWSPPPVLIPVRPGDRLGGFPAGTPRAILVWAAWSRPAVLEKKLIEEVMASGSAAASRVQIVTLDMDDPESARPIEMLGGAPAVPILYLVSSDGVVRRRFVGWPARNPVAVRTVLIRELTALAAR